jgi:uncharacterized protein YllA (UPF0747 family)
MPDDQHDDDRHDPRRQAAIAVAQAALAAAPVHTNHRHGVVVGVALDPTDEASYMAVIAIVQGVDLPCWIALDDDDLERIAAFLELRATKALARPALN